MTDGTGVLELRMRRSWRLVVATAVVVAAVIIALGTYSIVAEDRLEPAGLLLVGCILATLGGLIVLPGVAMLGRFARGVPTVRIDDLGVVWGSHRARDLSIDWGDVAGVTLRTVTNQVIPDRVFVIRPVDGRPEAAPLTRYGRIVAALNRSMYRTPFAISTVIADQPVERIRLALAARLEGGSVASD